MTLIRIGKLTIDTLLHQASYEKQLIHLTKSEIAIMEALAKKHKTGYLKVGDFKKYLPNNGGGDRKDGSYRVMLSNIQTKIKAASNGKQYIYSYIGHGYTLRDPDSRYDIPFTIKLNKQKEEVV